MTTLTLRIADDLKEQLDALAEVTGRTKSFLVHENVYDELKRYVREGE